jgi:bacteriocin-like protein
MQGTISCLPHGNKQNYEKREGTGMDDKTLAKLAILADKDPAIAEQLAKQAEAISDEELEQVTGGRRDQMHRKPPRIYR